MLNIVLIEPEIPNNTGNIGRLCVGMGCRLHLVHPLGFRITDTAVKRAGLDYWPHLDLHEYANVEHWLASVPDRSRVFLLSAKSSVPYYEANFQKGDWLVFGKESVGLDTKVMEKFVNHLRIPKSPLIRSYNIANSVAFVVGEARRQIGFSDL